MGRISTSSQKINQSKFSFLTCHFFLSRQWKRMSLLWTCSFYFFTAQIKSTSATSIVSVASHLLRLLRYSYPSYQSFVFFTSLFMDSFHLPFFLLMNKWLNSFVISSKLTSKQSRKPTLKSLKLWRWTGTPLLSNLAFSFSVRRHLLPDTHGQGTIVQGFIINENNPLSALLTTRCCPRLNGTAFPLIRSDSGLSPQRKLWREGDLYGKLYLQWSEL